MDLADARRRIDQLVWHLGHRRRQLRRSRLGRRLVRRRAGAVAVAVLLGWSVAHQVAAARAAERSWGRTDPVLVTTRALDAGEVLDRTTTTVRQVPARFVPDGTLDAVPPPGRRTATALRRGEMVVASRVSAGRGATAAALVDGTQAVTVARGEPPAALRPGDLVDAYAVVVAELTLEADTTDAPARVVAHEAVVLAVTTASATLAVREDEVAATVGAQAQGRLDLVVVG